MWIPRLNNRVASLQSVVQCPWDTPPLIHIQCNPSSFLLSAAYHVLVYQTVLKPGTHMWSGMCEWSYVSMKHNTLHSQYSLWVFISTASLSVLFPRDLTFLMMIAGTAGLCLGLHPPFHSGSAAPMSPLQLFWGLRPGSGQQFRFTEQCMFTQCNQLLACLNNALNDALLTFCS